MLAIERLLCAGAATLVIGLMGTAASVAQSYPERPATIVVGANPGGSADLYARMIAEALTVSLGQPFVVENMAGANSDIAASHVARAQPDGYTLFLGAWNTHAINANITQLDYDPIEDFLPISQWATGPLLLVVNNQVEAETIEEFIELLRANPGAYNFGSTAIGNGTHLACELFLLEAGAEAVHIPYGAGSGDMIAGLLSGESDFACDNISSSLPHVEAGALRGLAVTSAEESPVAPGVPPISSVLPGYDITGWHGMFAPAGTPDDVIALLAENIQAAAEDPRNAERLAALGATIVGSSPEEFAAHVIAETEKFRAIVTEAGISLN